MESDGIALPPALTTPLSRDALAARMSAKALHQLYAHTTSQDVFFVLKTYTRIDVGSWFGMQRVSICCLTNELVFLAPGKKPFMERATFDSVRESQYNHITAGLLLAPVENITITNFKMSPSDALQILAQINN